MKTTAKTAFALLMLITCASVAQAQSPSQTKKDQIAIGGNTGGGGSELVAKFVMRAKELVARVEKENPHNRDVENVKNILNSDRLKIVVRTKLLDPVTNEPIPDQGSLLAWGSPDLIQLKPNEWEEAFRNGKKVDHHIFHELCRAAVDCNDEAYRISIGQLKLDPGSQKSLGDKILEEALVGRKSGEPMTNYEDCVRPDNHRYSASTKPSLSEAILIACRKNFVLPKEQQSLIFASTNSLYGLDTVRQKYNLLEAWYKGDVELNKETRLIAETISNNQAIGICRRYAIEQGFDPKKCKLLAQFETEFVSADRRNPYFQFGGGYVARSLAILEK